MKHFFTFLVCTCGLAFGCMAQSQPEGFTVFEEDFNALTNIGSYFYSLPDGWTTYGDENTNYSSYSGFGQSWIGVALTSDNIVAASTSYFSSSTAQADRWLITPAIDLSCDNLSLVFKLYGNSESYPESVKVLLSTTNTDKTDFTTTLLNKPTVPVGANMYRVDLSAYAGQTVHIAFVNYGTNGYYTYIDDVRVMVPYSNEIALTELSLPSKAALGSDVWVRGTVTNYGIQPLTSFQVQYTDGNNTSSVYDVTGIQVAFGASVAFTHYLPFVPSQTGSNTLQVTVMRPNGQDDGTGDNTMSQSFTVVDAGNTVPRTVLLENMTTAQCGNCPSAHVRIKAALQGRKDVVWIAHHVGYGTDQWTLSASQTLTRFYNANGTYAPAAMLDRTHFTGAAFTNGENAAAPGPIFLPSNDVADAIQTAAEVFSYVRVGLNNTTFNAETREVQTTVSVDFTETVEMSTPCITLYLIEDSLYGTQSGGGSRYQHDHVVRATVTPITGESGVITSTAAGDHFEKSYTLTLTSGWTPEHCRLVAFVNNYESASSQVNNCNVMNTTISDYLHDGEVGVDEAGRIDLRIYPNPTHGSCVIEGDDGIEMAQVVNMMGQEVMTLRHDGSHQMTLSTRALAAGIYLVKVKSHSGLGVIRMVVE